MAHGDAGLDDNKELCLAPDRHRAATMHQGMVHQCQDGEGGEHEFADLQWSMAQVIDEVSIEVGLSAAHRADALNNGENEL